MKRNFDTVLTDFSGVPFKNGEPKFSFNDAGAVVMKDGQPVVATPAPDLTLKNVALDAIGRPLEGDDKLSGQEKMALYDLAHRISKGGIVELTTDEQAKLLKRIEKMFIIPIYGCARMQLETDPTSAAE